MDSEGCGMVRNRQRSRSHGLWRYGATRGDPGTRSSWVHRTAAPHGPAGERRPRHPAGNLSLTSRCQSERREDYARALAREGLCSETVESAIGLRVGTSPRPEGVYCCQELRHGTGRALSSPWRVAFCPTGRVCPRPGAHVAGRKAASLRG